MAMIKITKIELYIIILHGVPSPLELVKNFEIIGKRIKSNIQKDPISLPIILTAVKYLKSIFIAPTTRQIISSGNNGRRSVHA